MVEVTKPVFSILDKLGSSLLEVTLFLREDSERGLVLVQAVSEGPLFNIAERGLGKVEAGVLGAPFVSTLSVLVPHPSLVFLCLLSVELRRLDSNGTD